MRHIPQYRPARREVCREAASWRCEGVPRAIVGLPAGRGCARRRRILGHRLGQRAGRERQRLA
jgi:hypothetical protein